MAENWEYTDNIFLLKLSCLFALNLLTIFAEFIIPYSQVF